MNVIGADPFVLKDPVHHCYYAYATGGDGKAGHRKKEFLIYRSEDLVSWKMVGFALDTSHPLNWGESWFWAPECYYNPNNGHYYLFYSARVKKELVSKYFGTDTYEECCKIGVAVSKSPEGPFINFTDHPIEYFPYDPDYVNVDAYVKDVFSAKVSEMNLDKAPRGTYIPQIDADLFIDEDNRIYLYYSRCCYMNNLADRKLDRFIEESNILCVELDPAFWYDKEAKTQPSIHPSYVGYDKENPSIRKDGWKQIISYHAQPQDWENGHVEDYQKSNGEKHNRRWAEGSYTLRHRFRDKDEYQYLIFYSCNNFENALYGVGAAISSNPTSGFVKYEGNPVIHQIPEERLYSTGHGCITTKDGEYYYVFHGRDSLDAERTFYCAKLHLDSPENIYVSDITHCRLIEEPMAKQKDHIGLRMKEE